ncbi:MAG: hypothetical protein ACRD0Q_04085 [Acidimicrobiales bacterium]
MLPALAVAIDWDEARSALGRATAQLTAMLRNCDRPHAPALGVWDVTELAIHVSTAIAAVAAMARGTEPLMTNLSQLSVLTEMLVSGETETDLAKVADRIDAGGEDLLGVMNTGSDDTRSWLVAGIEMRLSTLTCHALNEIVVHGHDLARAMSRPWTISGPQARLVLNGFLFPVLAGLGRAIVDQKAAAGVSASFDVRLRGGGRTYMTFNDGDLTLSDSPVRPVDCHLSVDPAAFLLVAWGRQSQWPAIARGQLVAWGRRPWQGVKLRSLVTNP